MNIIMLINHNKIDYEHKHTKSEMQNIWIKNRPCAPK